MTPAFKKFHKDYAKTLMNIADGDLQTAKILTENPGGRPENTCYFIQQAIEKSFKAVLCHLEKNVPLTCDLGALISVLPKEIEHPKNESLLIGLSEFATVRRYEEGHFQITIKEIDESYRSAELVIQWANQIIQP